MFSDTNSTLECIHQESVNKTQYKLIPMQFPDSTPLPPSEYRSYGPAHEETSNNIVLC